MDHDVDGETSYNTFVDDVAFEPTYSQALLTAAGRNVATPALLYSDTQSIVGFSVIPKCMTLNDLEWLSR